MPLTINSPAALKHGVNGFRSCTTEDLSVNTYKSVSDSGLISKIHCLGVDYCTCLRDNVTKRYLFYCWGLKMAAPSDIKLLVKISYLGFDLMDTASASSGLSPLKESPVRGFSFLVNDKYYTIEADSIDAAQTYSELVAAIKDANKPTDN